MWWGLWLFVSNQSVNTEVKNSLKKQTHRDRIQNWTRKWRLIINENKSTHVTFTLRKGNIPQLYNNNNTIPQAEAVKYPVLHFDKRLNWKHHITQTRKHLNLKTRELYWILGRHSLLSLLNKTLIYKVVLRPVWTYGIELWGCASSSNIEILQRCQSKMLRLITQAPWYVTNQTLHRDLGIAPVREFFKDEAEAHRKTLSAHPNPLFYFKARVTQDTWHIITPSPETNKLFCTVLIY
jgi:hypothetical protein